MPSTFSSVAVKSLFVVAFAAAVWQIAHIGAAPLTLITQVLPDDTFYYLEIARNLAMRGISSVDGGQTLTTGYHVLWAWIAAAIAHLVHFDRMAMLRGMIFVSGIIALATVAAAASYAWKRSLILLSVITLAISSFSFLYNSVSAMEWSLTVFFATTIAILLATVESATRRGLYLAALFAAGMLGSLARSDFGGQAACYVFGAFCVWLARDERKYFVPSLSALAGAATGLGITLARDYILSGTIVQGSARMKSIWSAIGGHSPLPFIPIVARSLIYDLIHRPKAIHSTVANINGSGAMASAGQHGVALTVAVLAAIAVFLTVWILACLSLSSSEAPAAASRQTFFVTSAASTILLYAAVDMLNSFALQIWYSAQITVPLVLLLYFLAAALARAGHKRWTVAALSLLTVSNLVCFALSKPKYGAQARMIDVAPAMRQLAGNERVGVPDSGIFNFVYGGSAINLDGLVNNEIVDYAPSRLPCYLADKRVTFFTGFGETAEIALHPRPYDDFSTASVVALPGNDSFIVRKLDLARARALPECAASHNDVALR